MWGWWNITKVWESSPKVKEDGPMGKEMKLQVVKVID